MAEHGHRREIDPGKLETTEPEFPEIEKRRRFDRETHEKRALDAGVPEEEAREHATEDVEDGARDEGKR